MPDCIALGNKNHIGFARISVSNSSSFLLIFCIYIYENKDRFGNFFRREGVMNSVVSLPIGKQEFGR